VSMYSLYRTEIEVLSDVIAILIPDGTKTTIKKGSSIFIQQILGGMFTIQTDEGMLARIDGRYAQAIGQPIPIERREVTKEEVNAKGLKQCINDQLKTCYDPEIPVNIVDLGLIYRLEILKDIDDDSLAIIKIAMTLTSPGCGMGEILKSDVEKKLIEIPGVKYVVVDLVFDPPWESSMMSEAAKLHLGF